MSKKSRKAAVRPGRRGTYAAGGPVSGDALAPYIRGAVRLVTLPDGLVVPKRFSEKQMRHLEAVGRGRRACATAGVVIDLLTTGDEVSFDCEVLRGLDELEVGYQEVMEVAPAGSVAEAGVVDGMDALVGDSAAYALVPEDGTIRLEFENPWRREVEVRIYLPYVMCVAVGNLATNGSLAPAPQRDVLLALGDSITQGFFVGHPSASYPAQLARALGLDLVNQGIAGHTFDEDSLRGMGFFRERAPRAIVVAYGVNDWSHGGTCDELRAGADAYLARLARKFPEVPTYVLTPIWRKDEDAKLAVVACGKPLSWMHEMETEAAAPYPEMTVVRGHELFGGDASLFGDGRIHPNAAGATLIADALLAAMRTGGQALPVPTEGDGDAVLASGAAEASDGGGAEGEPLAADGPSGEGGADAPAEALAPAETLPDAVDREARSREGAPGTHPEFDRLVRTIWRLRQPDGCPWDKVQTHESITRNMVEEAYEAVDAIHEGSVPHLREELGDVLEQVLLHSQIAADEGEFDVDDVCRDLDEKLVRRHPHVFGSLAAGSAGQALDIWDDVKKAERAAAPAEVGLLDSVPRSLPALMQCQKVSKRAAKAGFEWETTEDVWRQAESERQEFLAEEPGSDARALEFGDLLFALVNVARREGIDAEAALDASVRKFRRRWKRMEGLAREAGREIDSYTTEELNALWDEAKAEERAGE